MKTKFKDFLLYSLACIGAVSLLLSAYQPQQTISTVPESHVFDIHIQTTTTKNPLLLNKVTGEVWDISTNQHKLYKVVNK